MAAFMAAFFSCGRRLSSSRNARDLLVEEIAAFRVKTVTSPVTENNGEM
jgi:hypothetical protein